MGETDEKSIKHPIPPVYDANSEILILGSFPSVKSREIGFFYGHKQNRFWKVTSAVFNEKTPESLEEKKEFLLRNHIAVWDVIASCEIKGSSDASIKNVKANDLSVILDNSRVEQIYVNGKTAEKMYNKYIFHSLKRECIVLPSTSPANAAWNTDKLVGEWKAIKERNTKDKVKK